MWTIAVLNFLENEKSDGELSSLVSLYFCMYNNITTGCDTNGIVLEVKEVAYTVKEVKDANTGSF